MYLCIVWNDCWKPQLSRKKLKHKSRVDSLRLWFRHRIIVLMGKKCGVLLDRPNGVLIKSGVVLVQRFSKYLPLRLIFIGQFFFRTDSTYHIPNYQGKNGSNKNQFFSAREYLINWKVGNTNIYLIQTFLYVVLFFFLVSLQGSLGSFFYAAE